MMDPRMREDDNVELVIPDLDPGSRELINASDIIYNWRASQNLGAGWIPGLGPE